jgi:hypothetical protein
MRAMRLSNIIIGELQRLEDKAAKKWTNFFQMAPLRSNEKTKNRDPFQNLDK